MNKNKTKNAKGGGKNQEVENTKTTKYEKNIMRLVWRIHEVARGKRFIIMKLRRATRKVNWRKITNQFRRLMKSVKHFGSIGWEIH